MTDQEKLLYIEAERAKLQKRLSKKTGLKIDLQAMIHNIDANGDNQALARAGLANGWHISRSKQLGWVATPDYASTTVFFNRSKRQVTA